MGKPRGFIEFDRQTHSKRTPKERLLDWNEHVIRMTNKDIENQAARCMNCGIPYCSSGVILEGLTTGCPLHNLIPEWNDLVYKGKYEDAYRRLEKTNPFPEFTSRVCPAPCEGACTTGLNLDSVSIKGIEYEIIETAFKNSYVKSYNGPKTNKRIAVIGSGPAGLSAAHYLTNVGHTVTVFEKSDKPGGLLMYGIPQMKLEKSIIQRRIEIMEESGVTFKCNTEFGTDINSEQLEQEFDAILLATGTQVARDINVEGRNLIGVHFALEFLTNNTKHLLDDRPLNISTKDKHVVIIGGGDTATDCVATSIRQGCKSVTQLEIMPEKEEYRNETKNPWPEYPKVKTIDYGHQEAIELFNTDPRTYLTTCPKINGEDGVVKSIDTVTVKWEKKRHGKFVPKPIKASIQNIPADIVLIAIGFLGPNEEVISKFNIRLDKNIHNSETENFVTEKEHVFVTGDMRIGQSLVVTALQEGKLVAKEIDIYLMGTSSIE